MAKVFAEHFLTLDGLELLYRKMQENLAASSEMAAWFKKLAAVEESYAKSLLKLVASKGPSTSRRHRRNKKNNEEASEPNSTIRDCYEQIHSEVEAEGNKHANHALQILNDISQALTIFVKEKEASRKKLVTDGTKLTKEWNATLAALAKAKNNYYSKCKEADNLQSQFDKAKAEGSMKSKDFSKLNTKATKALEVSKIADKEYQKTLKKTNDKQKKLFSSELPTLLSQFQAFEEDRLSFIKNCFQKYQGFRSEFPPHLQKTLEALQNSVGNIDIGADIASFSAAHKTGDSLPADKQYEPYSSNNPNFGSVGGSAPRPAAPASAAPAKVGLSAEDSSLSDEEKAQKLQEQIDMLDSSIASETNAMKGLEKLVQFYASDPVAQEKAKGELEDQRNKIKSMESNKEDLQRQVQALGGGAGDTSADTSYDTGYDNTGYDTTDYGATDLDYSQDTAAEEEVAKEAGDGALPTVAKARALYDYAATNDTELSFSAGDILNITDQDESGWWYAEIDGTMGFVPNNYLEEI